MVIGNELFDKIKRYFEDDGGYDASNFLHLWIWEDLIEKNDIKTLEKLFNHNKNVSNDFIDKSGNDYSDYTTSINLEYKDEKNPLSKNYNPNLIYADEITRFTEYHLKIKNDKFYKGIDNQPIWVSELTNGRYNFAMDEKGNIFVHKKQNNEVFQHSSFLSGKNVVCAGYFELNDDGLFYIDNKSGHYTPSHESLNWVVLELTTRGFDIDKIRMSYR